MGRRVLLGFALLALWAVAALAGPGDSLRVIPGHVTLRPGARGRFAIRAGNAPTTRVRWSLRGPGLLVPAPDLTSADYLAPWRSERTAEAVVRAAMRREPGPVGDSLVAVATVSLAAGRVAGSESCEACAANKPALRGEFAMIDSMPEAILRVPPTYPPDARAARAEGTVIVMALVCCSGVVVETQVIKSIPLLDEAAVTAVRQWRFRPALSAGRPVDVWGQIPVKFNFH